MLRRWSASLLGCLALASVASAQHVDDAPIRPDKTIKLFEGDSLRGFESWLKGSGRDDPNKVFSVRDGILHVSGDGFGYVSTQRSYRDYRLVAEFKWGKKTDGGKYVRNSGILLHATGPHGGGGGVWMASIECQLAQGCVGDLIPIRGKDAQGKAIPVEFKSETVLGPDKRPRWKTGGELRTFANRQLWWSLHDPDFKELLDTRGQKDVESPLGEWTKVECTCRGSKIEVAVNGVKINECVDAVPAAGRVLFQSEGFEVFFRNVALLPLGE